MKICLSLAVLAVCLMFPAMAYAGAWPQVKGDTQVIISYEPGDADQGFDASGDKTLSLPDWKHSEISAYVGHGITDRLTLTGKITYRDYSTDITQFSGLSSIELGGQWTIKRSNSFVLAVGATAEGLGKGQRSDIDSGTRGGTDYDFRVYVGKSFSLAGKQAFADVQTARHVRQYEADQWRFDATVGIKTSTKWMVLAQTFSGRTDKQSWGHATWVNAELSMVRSFGPKQQTSLQVGIRQTIAGENAPAVRSLVVSLWKNF